MKRFLPAALAVALTLALSACGKLPKKDLVGNDWNEDWQNIGFLLGVEAPDGFKLESSSEALATRGVSFATWGKGELETYENEQGQETRIYDVQIFVLLQRFSDGSAAQDAASQWLDVEAENYTLAALPLTTHNGQTFSRFALEPVGESEFLSGVLALAVCGDSAVSVELMARDDIPDSELAAALDSFLNGVHFRDFSEDE